MNERAYFHMEGNNGSDYLTLLGDKKRDDVVRVEIGHCCVMARVQIPIEALTYLLFDLASNPKELRKRLQDSGWPKEFREKLVRKIRRIKALWVGEKRWRR